MLFRSPAIELQNTADVAPGVTLTEFVDETGAGLRASASMLPGMNMEMVLADEKIAKQQINPPELVATTLLHPDRAIHDPRSLKRGVYELRVSAGAGENQQPRDLNFKAALPAKSVQHVEWLNASTARVSSK